MKRYTSSLLLGMQRLTQERFIRLADGGHYSAILDLGCGNGELTMRVAQKVGAKMVAGIEIGWPAAKMSLSRGINVILGDVNDTFPFKDEVFDLVLANQIIEHLNNTDNFLREVRRVLKNGGSCIVATPNLSGLQNIVSLMMGYQPPTAEVSDELFGCGNPFNPVQNTIGKYIGHRRIFTAPALKALMEFHGLKCERITGFGMHPLPLFISRLITSSRYSPVIAIKARKTNTQI
jgi:methionine biosynthesis protein MetW